MMPKLTPKIAIVPAILVASTFTGAPASSKQVVTLDGHTKLEWQKSKGPAVEKLRCLLEKAGYLNRKYLKGELYDGPVAGGVKRFQAANNLRKVGHVRQGTMRKLKQYSAYWAQCVEGKSARPAPDQKPKIRSKDKNQAQRAAIAVPRPRARPTKPEAKAKSAVRNHSTSFAPLANVPKRLIRPEHHLNRKPHDAFVRPGMNRQFKRAIARYKKIVRRGGWKPLPRSIVRYKPFIVGKAYPQIRRVCRRLALEKYISPAKCSNVYTRQVQRALLKFKHRHQLRQNDVLGSVTRSFLNVSARAKLHALRKSFHRHKNGPASKIDLKAASRYIVLNTPAGRVQYVNGGKLEEYLTVLGSRYTRSPDQLIYATSITLTPTWTPSWRYRRKNLDKKYRNRPKALIRSNFRVFPVHSKGRKRDILHSSRYGKKGTKLMHRPGPNNPLGLLRINTPNRSAIFLHSTNNFALFDKAVRYQSGGCARVDGILDLASRMFRDTKTRNWSKYDLYRKLGEHNGGWAPGKTIPLKRKIPVLWVYYTAWPAADGTVEYRRDRYNRD